MHPAVQVVRVFASCSRLSEKSLASLLAKLFFKVHISGVSQGVCKQVGGMLQKSSWVMRFFAVCQASTHKCSSMGFAHLPEDQIFEGSYRSTLSVAPNSNIERASHVLHPVALSQAT